MCCGQRYRRGQALDTRQGYLQVDGPALGAIGIAAGPLADERGSKTCVKRKRASVAHVCIVLIKRRLISFQCWMALPESI
jgi:hypothetical protein